MADDKNKTTGIEVPISLSVENEKQTSDAFKRIAVLIKTEVNTLKKELSNYSTSISKLNAELSKLKEKRLALDTDPKATRGQKGGLTRSINSNQEKLNSLLQQQKNTQDDLRRKQLEYRNAIKSAVEYRKTEIQVDNTVKSLTGEIKKQEQDRVTINQKITNTIKQQDTAFLGVTKKLSNFLGAIRRFTF